jgi:2-phosphoglycolate phosphatase
MPASNRPASAVLFDLDGTLVDTAPDLVAVLNALLAADGRPPVPYALARNEVSRGALGLLDRAYGGTLTPARRELLRQRFLDLYAENISVNSRLFILISDILNSISITLPGASWGIVTNKPRFLTEALLDRLGIANAPHCVVSGDDLPQRKPDPAPLRHAAQSIGVPPSSCLYIGDAKGDIVAGRAAGMRTVAAAYGYIRPDEDIASWQADAVLMRPTDLAQLLARLWA